MRGYLITTIFFPRVVCSIASVSVWFSARGCEYVCFCLLIALLLCTKTCEQHKMNGAVQHVIYVNSIFADEKYMYQFPFIFRWHNSCLHGFFRCVFSHFFRGINAIDDFHGRNLARGNTLFFFVHQSLRKQSFSHFTRKKMTNILMRCN